MIGPRVSSAIARGVWKRPSKMCARGSRCTDTCARTGKRLSETERLQGEGERERGSLLLRRGEGDAPSQVLLCQHPHAPCAEAPVLPLCGKVAAENLLLNDRLDVRGVVHVEPDMVCGAFAEPDGDDGTRGGSLQAVFQHVAEDPFHKRIITDEGKGL